MEKYSFTFVKSPTGSISGESIIRQTEDAVNALGTFTIETSAKADKALQAAGQSGQNASQASQNAANAITAANAALQLANTVALNVSHFDERITNAESNADSAARAAGAVLQTANNAVDTANAALKRVQQIETSNGKVEANVSDALRDSQAAVQTAQDAKNLADAAKKTAADAVVDAEKIYTNIEGKVSEAETHATNARIAANDSEASKTIAAANATQAERWASQVTTPVTGSEEAGNAVYSARQYALNASQLVAHAVNWDAQQTLTPLQQWTALTNIGAVPFIAPTSGSVPDASGVAHDIDFALTAEQKRIARENIGALGDGDPIDAARKDGAGNVIHETYYRKSGSNGAVSAYSETETTETAVMVTENVNDSLVVTGAVDINVPDSQAAIAWDKTVDIRNAAATITLGTNWAWAGGATPTVSANAVLVLHWADGRGLAALQGVE